MLIKKFFGLSIVSLEIGESLVVFREIPTNAKDYAEVDVVARYKRRLFSYDKSYTCYSLVAKKNIIVLLKKYDNAAESARSCLSIRDNRAMEGEGAVDLSIRRIGKKRFLLYSCEAIVEDSFSGDSCIINNAHVI